MLRKAICTALFFLQTLNANEPMLDISYFQKLPKAELHLHLGGSYPLNYLLSIATQEQKTALEQNLNTLASGVDYHSCFAIFPLISQIVNTDEKIQMGMEALCQSLQDDGVTYAEIRTGLKNLKNGHEAYLQAVLQGMKNRTTDTFTPKLLLSLQRNSSIEIAKLTVDLALKYKKKGIVGIDISGVSTLGQSDQILPELLRAKQEGLGLVVHIGEALGETDQLLLLQELHPDRVGHGVHLSQEAKEWILERSIPMEVCLTSSVLVQMISSFEEHPGLNYFQQGHPIALCTDDPLLFSTSLSKELLIAHQQGGLSIEEIEQIVQNSFSYALKNSSTYVDE